MSTKKENKLGLRTWMALLVFGLIGQVAWVVENMYFNVFLYNTITYCSSITTTMSRIYNNLLHKFTSLHCM